MRYYSEDAISFIRSGALDIGNCNKVTYNYLTARGDTASFKRGVTLVTLVKRIRDLYYTSDIYTSV
jgi:hypothetical protein